MYVEINTAQGASEVRDTDDLKSFSVKTDRPTDGAALGRALGALGRIDGDHAWIDIEQLRATTGRDDDAAWSEQFDAMVAYAISKGWVDEAGTALQAHIEDL